MPLRNFVKKEKERIPAEKILTKVEGEQNKKCKKKILKVKKKIPLRTK